MEVTTRRSSSRGAMQSKWLQPMYAINTVKPLSPKRVGSAWRSSKARTITGEVAP